MYIPRYLEDVILKIHRTFKVLYLGGPRQVGKTTLLLHLAQSKAINYVTLDDLSARRLAKEDPELFLQTYSRPLFIDEVQYAPELFPVIKSLVDQSPKTGQYWLTGSQQFSIMKNIRESLAGRIGIISLLGFSLAEEKKIKKQKNPFLPGAEKGHFVEKRDVSWIFRHILRGSYPAMARKNAPPLETFYNSYLQTYLDRDLADIFHVTKLSTFHKFLQLCAARTGQILNYSELAKDTGISVHAVQEWIGILEASLQIYLLRPYYKNISKRIIKAPKLYFLDTGLVAFLTKWKDAAALAHGAMAGAFFETWVIGEIIKSYLHRGEEPPLYYFRDKEGHEIDIIIERNNQIFPVEIKMAGSVSLSDLRHIHYLRKKLKNIGHGALISISKNRFPLDRKNEVIPASIIS